MSLRARGESVFYLYQPIVSKMDGSGSGGVKKRPSRIQWDEETIAEHDKDRGTRQKVYTPWPA